MESELKLKEVRDEVLKKIGRNVIFFQQMELMLKHIISEWTFSGYSSEIEKKKSKKKASVSKQTMGQLIDQFMTDTHSEFDAPIKETKKKEEIYFSTSIRVGCDKTYYEAKKQKLSEIVSDRNELIHHLLPGFNPNSIESCLETDQYLDKQRDKLLPEHDSLKKLILSGKEARKNLKKFIESEQFMNDLKLSSLRQSRLVILIAEIASQNARTDGWTLLNIAGKILHQEAPEEIASINKQYNHKTLKDLILATGVFDLYEEPTEKGGIRLLYRLKADWELKMGFSPTTISYKLTSNGGS
jgi:hypothetical protein